MFAFNIQEEPGLTIWRRLWPRKNYSIDFGEWKRIGKGLDGFL